MKIRALFEQWFNTAKTASPADRAATKNLGKSQTGRDWRDDAVKAARKTYGRPFKCAPEGMDREVMIGKDKWAVAKAGEKPVRPDESAPVSILRNRSNA